MRRKILIIGASGHGKVVADIAQKNGYTDIAFLDDDVSKRQCGKYKVIGTSDDAILHDGDNFIVAIGNAKTRQHIQINLLGKGLSVVTLVHPGATIAGDVKVGIGTVVMAGVVINSDVKLGNGVIVNTSSSIDHDCIIEDFVHISVGSHIAGSCQIGKRTWIGAGAIVSNNVIICNDCIIGAGGVVLKDINESDVYTGVPVRKNEMSKKFDKYTVWLG